MEEKRYYTVNELTEILGVCRQTVYKLLKRKAFASTKVGSKHRINKKSFDEWFDKCSQEQRQ